MLIEYFLERMRERHPGRDWTISREAMVHLWSYDWPGNVRELENMVERLVVLCEGSTIESSLLPANLVDGARAAEPRIPANLGDGGIKLSNLVREFEGRLMNEALRRTQGNKQAAARLLGLKRTTFSAKLRRCGVFSSEPPGSRSEQL